MTIVSSANYNFRGTFVSNPSQTSESARVPISVHPDASLLFGRRLLSGGSDPPELDGLIQTRAQKVRSGGCRFFVGEGRVYQQGFSGHSSKGDWQGLGSTLSGRYRWRLFCEQRRERRRRRHNARTLGQDQYVRDDPFVPPDAALTPNSGLDDVMPLIVTLGDLYASIVKTRREVENGHLRQIEFFLVVVLHQEGQDALGHVLHQYAYEEQKPHAHPVHPHPPVNGSQYPPLRGDDQVHDRSHAAEE
mmetsp:Transcript_51983/g.110440  ORF Transcript_51983/g.110440 Transcript_51983/m.110440 type:complete len:247 (-) Transcript_51983:249-989(-)